VTSKKEKNPVSRFWTKLNLMAEVAAVFRKAPPEKATYIKALELIQSVVPFQDASLYLISHNKKKVFEVASCGTGFNPSPYDNIDDFMGWMSLQRTATLISDMDQYREVNKARDESILVVPLLVEEKLIGTVVYITASGQSFPDKSIKLLTVIGDQIALSIERLIYQRELEKKNDELFHAQEQLKEAQAQIISDEKLEAVRQLAVSVNHEINNPLSVITGNVEYLLYIHKDLNPKIVDRLHIIESEALRIAGINRKLLDIQTLVSENYVGEDKNIKMLNLEKSTTGEDDD